MLLPFDLHQLGQFAHSVATFLRKTSYDLKNLKKPLKYGKNNMFVCVSV